VLIHHGVPAVLGMTRLLIEALSFIRTFAQALRSRLPIDQAVAIARQQLLTLYKFNYPAWTLPVLSCIQILIELICADEDITQLPGDSLFDEIGQPFCKPRCVRFQALGMSGRAQVSHEWGAAKRRITL